MTGICSDGFWCIQFKDLFNTMILLITILAIYFAPLKASLITDKQSQKNEARKRKQEILSSLMKTRRMFLVPEHVWALNAIQLEFIDDEKVILAYKEYIRRRNIQSVDVTTQYLEDAEAVFFDLIQAIAANLGLTLDKADLKGFSYSPQGWATDDTQLKHVRGLMIDLMEGRKPLFVVNAAPPNAKGKFPPPPGSAEV